MKLQTLNKHARDFNVEFYTEGHKYVVNGFTDYISVTTIIKKIYPGLNTDMILKKMRTGPEYKPGHKYWGMSDNEIKQLWKDIGQQTSIQGSILHENIEKYLNDVAININPELNEWKFFLNFISSYNKTPYRTEWMIYDDEYKLCGTVDMVFKNDDDTYNIIDWKRTKKISIPRSKVPCNTTYWHYAIQLNYYKYILEKNYNIKIDKLIIVQLHPEQDEFKTYEMPVIEDFIINTLKNYFS